MSLEAIAYQIYLATNQAVLRTRQAQSAPDPGRALGQCCPHWPDSAPASRLSWFYRMLGSIPSKRKTFVYNICTTLAQRRRRWADVVQMLYNMFPPPSVYISNRKRMIGSTLVLCRVNVRDAGPALSQWRSSIVPAGPVLWVSSEQIITHLYSCQFGPASCKLWLAALTFFLIYTRDSVSKFLQNNGVCNKTQPLNYHFSSRK